MTCKVLKSHDMASGLIGRWFFSPYTTGKL